MNWTIWAILAAGLVAIVVWKRLATRLSPEETEAIRRAVEDGAVIVDVRTTAEFQRGHLDGALNIPLNELMRDTRRIGRKKQPVVVYCHSGSRSGMAVSYLKQAGFARAHNLRVMRNWEAVRQSSPAA